mmetsp:Transcript_1148/g.2087  ORF Transcript_1148/g.2087 Transcript_1148/m.2087 type:complete len:82 (-) Transcript_1148:283-528(-)
MSCFPSSIFFNGRSSELVLFHNRLKKLVDAGCIIDFLLATDDFLDASDDDDKGGGCRCVLDGCGSGGGGGGGGRRGIGRFI